MNKRQHAARLWLARMLLGSLVVAGAGASSRMESPLVARGLVLEARSGRPARGATVTIEHPSAPSVMIRTDSAGHFEAVIPAPDPMAEVVLRASRGHATSEPVVLTIPHNQGSHFPPIILLIDRP